MSPSTDSSAQVSHRQKLGRTLALRGSLLSVWLLGFTELGGAFSCAGSVFCQRAACFCVLSTSSCVRVRAPPSTCFHVHPRAGPPAGVHGAEGDWEIRVIPGAVAPPRRAAWGLCRHHCGMRAERPAGVIPLSLPRGWGRLWPGPSDVTAGGTQVVVKCPGVPLWPWSNDTSSEPWAQDN